MITNEVLQKLARQYQTAIFPNIAREYFQHVFLSELYKLPEAKNLLFKGGTALRVIYGSPRFSEDLDFFALKAAGYAAPKTTEDLFIKVLSAIERLGIKVEIGRKSGQTSGGYFGAAAFKMENYPAVGVKINISARHGKGARGEVDSIANDFVPTYTVIHLPQEELAEEKIFGALLERKKPRDYYDLYFMMRKGMLSAGHKKRLKKIKDKILADARGVNFKAELGVFLPADQQAIIHDFPRALKAELNRQVI